LKTRLELFTPFTPTSLHTKPETLGQSVHSLVGLSEKDIHNKIILIGFPDDRGVLANHGNSGAKEGPAAFRKAFYSLYDTHVPGNIGREIVDAGNIALGNDIASSHEKLALAVQFFLEHSAKLVIVIGGGHDFSFGSFKGHVSAIPGIIPIINLDAHLDLRPVENGSINSGTPFFRILEHFPHAIAKGKALLELGIQKDRNPPSLFEYAKQHHVKVVEFDKGTWLEMRHGEKTALGYMQDHLSDCTLLGWDHTKGGIHYSLDLDVFSSTLAPGTSAATPFGCNLDDILEATERLMKLANLRVFDIAELCPARDFNGQTARLAAGIVYRAICAKLLKFG
jgi:formiminoglutamase